MKTRNTLIAAFLTAGALVAADSLQAAEPSAAPAVGRQTSAAAVIKGKVLETVDSGGYTYVQVDTGSEKVWAASSPATVKVGDAVSFASDMPMENFESKTLKRKFEKIYFVDKLRMGSDAGAKESPVALPPDHPPIGQKMAAPATLDASKVEKAPGGKLISEVFAGKVALAGQKVTVRGLVVRFNPSILDRNWLRLRDASCQGVIPDLSVTSKDEVKVGQVVTVSGVLATNKDFGAGYRYDVLIEDAAVVAK